MKKTKYGVTIKVGDNFFKHFEEGRQRTQKQLGITNLGQVAYSEKLAADIMKQRVSRSNTFAPKQFRRRKFYV